MIRNILILLILYPVITLGQIQDSVTSEIKIYPDTISIRTDSLLTNDSLFTIVKRDSLVPLYYSPLTEKSFIVSNKAMKRLEYQYAGDYLRLFQFNFIKDLGFTGQPNETFLYGVGNDAISYLIDGISFNDRYSNSLNLNFIQSEDVDSVEIIPLPRGFLYGAYNNPVSVNYITKDFLPAQPYTRLRFYQGANRDMMLDGSFNAIITNRLIASFDIANRIFDGTYTNSDYSIWQGKVKLKYLLSNAINIIATYNYNDYKAGYNGGINVDSIIALGENVDNVMYDFRVAPVVYPKGELKTLTHLPKLRFLIKPFENFMSDLSFFYLYNDYQKISQSKQSLENKIFGINFRNDFRQDLFSLQIITDYEKGKNNLWEERNIDTILYHSNIPASDYDLFSVAGNVSLNLFEGVLVPSAFGKLSSYYTISGSRDFSDNPLSFGFDLKYKPAKMIELYLGYSIPQYYSRSDISDNLFEAAAKINFENLNASIRYFQNNHQRINSDFSGYYNTKNYGNVSGVGLDFNFRYSFFLLQSNLSFYTSLDDEKMLGVPDFQTQTGLYYTSILFNDNLDLKTGFVFYYTGTNNVFTREHGVTEVPSSYKLDFTLVGEIQKTAIVYFTWQNLIDNQYYITPYYPMLSRSIRFGVAWELFN
ncbi:MAG: TonB-dependent receptor plug domain-containing protein [Ignavibacterium sp.]|nr:TonB-dependent receptor plug domain-containing protein [Ignavibacterium sp.]